MISLEFLYYSPQLRQTALNSGKVTKLIKMATFDTQKSELESRKTKYFPESI